MNEHIAVDSHKRYTWMERMDLATGEVVCRRIEHAPGAIRRALEGTARGTPVAIEATANWYCIVGEIGQAGLEPQLVHPRKAKLMMGLTNKTDRLDAHGMNRLQQNRTLPVVWIPPGRLRDQRELTRTRVALGKEECAFGCGLPRCTTAKAAHYRKPRLFSKRRRGSDRSPAAHRQDGRGAASELLLLRRRSPGLWCASGSLSLVCGSATLCRFGRVCSWAATICPGSGASAVKAAF